MLWLREYWSSKFAKALGALGWRSRVDSISAPSLASLSDEAGGKLILFDLRDLHEIEKYSYSIPGALLTVNVDLPALVRWIPRKTTVALYAENTIPAHDSRLHLAGKQLEVYALDGGLQSWCKAGLPVEPIVLTDRRSVDNR